jgi:pilus assembly protein CpaB
MLHSLRRRLPRIGRTPRLLAAGLCLLLALTSALGARRDAGPAPRSVPVVVAAHDLPAGHRLGRGDLRVAHWPPALRPSGGAAGARAFIGLRTAGPIRAREPLTSSRVVGTGLTLRLGSGSVAAAVALDDPHTADLVRPGDRVDLLETPRPADVDAAPARAGPEVATVATDALVLAVLPSTAEADAEVVLAVERATAVRLARDRAAHVFAVVADPP